MIDHTITKFLWFFSSLTFMNHEYNCLSVYNPTDHIMTNEGKGERCYLN